MRSFYMFPSQLCQRALIIVQLDPVALCQHLCSLLRISFRHMVCLIINQDQSVLLLQIGIDDSLYEYQLI